MLRVLAGATASLEFALQTRNLFFVSGVMVSNCTAGVGFAGKNNGGGATSALYGVGTNV